MRMEKREHLLLTCMSVYLSVYVMKFYECFYEDLWVLMLSLIGCQTKIYLGRIDGCFKSIGSLI